MTPPADIKLLLSDVDGTLVTKDKVLTEASKAAARALRGAGICLSLTSSRPTWGMRMLVEPLSLTTPLAGFNGGAFADPKDLSITESHPVDPHAAAEVAAYLIERDLDLWVYTEDDWFVIDPKGAHVEREAFILQRPPTVVRRFDAALTDHAFKVVGVSDDQARLAEAQKGAQTLLGDRASAARSSGHFLDVTHPLANKGQVVETLARQFGLRTDQIATIGDGDNDTLMFAKGGFSIAMGNSDDDVKAKAKVVTDSNENDGWAKAVQRFLLKGDAA
jgi:Cof subfamily protein (haloacid dehalogenase superfamily)